MRLFNKRLCKSSSAAGARQRLGALLFSPMLVGSAALAGAGENYRGHDPDSYECSSDYNILNRRAAVRSGGASLVELEGSVQTMAEQREKLTDKDIIEAVTGASLMATVISG